MHTNYKLNLRHFELKSDFFYTYQIILQRTQSHQFLININWALYLFYVSLLFKQFQIRYMKGNMKLNIALRNINCTDNKVKDGQIEKYFP